MLFFAVSALEKLRHLPRKDVVNLGLAALVLIIAIIIIKQAAKINKFILLAMIIMTIAVVGFTWVYERNEPKFLSPLVNELVPFFPSRPTGHW